MTAVYIREQGSTLSRNGERICIVKGGKTLIERPVFGIDNIAIFGNVQITSQALHMLLDKGIDVSYFSYQGKYLGHTASDTSKNIFLRMQQYDCYENIDRRCEIAKIIVSNKIENQIAVISGWRWKGDFDWKQDVEDMSRHLKTVEEKNTQMELMGVEGICSNIYFHSYAQMFSSELKFEKRSRRPPRNPVNVLLSLGYTLLTKEVTNALETQSFETYLGFLHGIRYGRKSLALDIVEEFRQPVIDRLVLKIINKGLLSKLDFEFPEEGVVILNEEGFRRFCTAYERWMNGTDTSSGDKSFRGRIREQVDKLKMAIQQEGIYEPYSWKNRDVRD